jgi:predicted amidohydrolase
MPSSGEPRLARVCGVQFAPEFGSPSRNTERIVREVTAAAAEGAELVVFPEAALTGYVFESLDEGLSAAVTTEGPEVRAIAGAAADSGAWVVCGAIERDGNALFNAALLVGPEGLIGRYRKVHTLCLGVDRFTRPGAEGFRAHELPFGRIGMHICYDGSFPESARALRLEGAQLLLLPTNWPRLRMRREMVQVRAYENHAFYFAVNRVGSERGVRFEGGSLAADPDGRLLLEAEAEPGRHHLELDLSLADATREVVRPGEWELDLIEDRQPERYGAVTRATPDARRTGSRRIEG